MGWVTDVMMLLGSRLPSLIVSWRTFAVDWSGARRPGCTAGVPEGNGGGVGDGDTFTLAWLSAVGDTPAVVGVAVAPDWLEPPPPQAATRRSELQRAAESRTDRHIAYHQLRTCMSWRDRDSLTVRA